MGDAGTRPTRFAGQGMTATRDHDVEALAREMLRQTILKSGWYPALKGEERQRRINRDVDLHWHLMLSEAQKRLGQRQELDA
jgi:hypothetical protein